MRAAPAWLTTATPQQRRTLTAAALGWMLDSMDVMLYAMVLPAIALEMHLSPSASGGMMSATLLAAAAGGLFFGWFADRLGRTRALTASMLIYSLATFACGLTHTAGQLAVARIALGLGMGGEWAAGAALVAETWPAIHRNKALALVQSFWAIGYALGAALTALILPTSAGEPSSSLELRRRCSPSGSNTPSMSLPYGSATASHAPPSAPSSSDPCAATPSSSPP